MSISPLLLALEMVLVLVWVRVTVPLGLLVCLEPLLKVDLVIRDP